MNVEDRLSRLECENRRLKVAGLLVLAVLGALLAMGQARPQPNLSGESLTLYRPGTNVAYVMMFTGTDGIPQVSVHDANGESRILLQVWDDSAWIRVRGSTATGTGAASGSIAFNSALDTCSGQCRGDGAIKISVMDAGQRVVWSAP